MRASTSYRFLLLTAFGVLLTFTLTVTGVAYWGATRADYHLQRSQLAHRVLEAHLALAADTYELFKQLADIMLVGGFNNVVDQGDSRENVKQSLSAVRKAIAAEIAYVDDPDERDEEIAELDHLAQIEQQIIRVLGEFETVKDSAAEIRGDEAKVVLKRWLDEWIDTEFRSLINAAIAQEYAEVSAADAAAERHLGRVSLLSRAAAASAVIVLLSIGFLLVRRLQQPLEALTQGTLALAEGNLAHRVHITGTDEFAQLSTNFNRMAEQLERQQQALNDARNNLEQQIAERTSELEAAGRALQNADRHRRRFFADISHELRTPLTVIRGEAEVALRGAIKEVAEYKTSLMRIVDQAQHTARLVDDLLFIARAESGQTRLQMRAVALRDMIEKVCADAEILGRDKNVVIEPRFDADDAVVSGDAGRLRQLFVILLDNAVRYSRPHGLVTVTVNRSPNGFVVNVADTGVGIAAEEMDRVFERFYRGNNASDAYAQGSGLGLPVAKAIVEAHGGEIAIESTLDRGTTISVTLPSLRKLRAVR